MALRCSVLFLVLLLPLLVWDPTRAAAKWQTLSGQAPLVIANGGTSGLYPDQTSAAYYDALANSLPGVILSCDLQLAKSIKPQLLNLGVGICRNNLNLKNSTDINTIAPQLNSTHVIDGVSTFGWFAIDIPYEILMNVSFATQSTIARSPAFDGEFSILMVDQVPLIINNTNFTTSTWWLNSEYTSFIEENSILNATLYLEVAITVLYPGYVSAPEITLLKKMQAAAMSSGTKLIYKFLDGATMDTSTNQTYVSLLQNLTYIKTFASGILVPRDYIWTVDPVTMYLGSPSPLVEDAHKANLEVYVYDFANDEYPISFNFTFDPVIEILYYIESYNFSVDGIFTDFPATASEAISCYASNSRNNSVQNKAAIPKKQTIISHNGNSGKYPGGTIIAYNSAIDAGVDYIDCIVQISRDSVPFCRPTVDLIESTNVVNNSVLFQTYVKQYPDFYGGVQGVYTFDLTWEEISSLQAIMFNIPGSGISRDYNYNGQFGIISLAEFLSLAKKNSIGVLIDIQNAVYLRDEHDLAVVDAVVEILSAAGYDSSDKVILQSEDSSALARLRDLNVTYPLMFEAISTPDNPMTLEASDLAEIKKYATLLNLYAELVVPIDSNYFLKVPPTDLVALAHDQNLTVYFQLQRNEFTAFAFDFEADPTMELFYWASLGIDGIITDFPITVEKYLANQCIGNGLTSSSVNFSIPLVTGQLGNTTATPATPAPGPAPELVIVESPLSGVPEGLAPAPASTMPAAASHISPYLLWATFSVVLHLLATM